MIKILIKIVLNHCLYEAYVINLHFIITLTSCNLLISIKYYDINLIKKIAVIFIIEDYNVKTVKIFTIKVLVLVTNWKSTKIYLLVRLTLSISECLALLSTSTLIAEHMLVIKS